MLKRNYILSIVPNHLHLLCQITSQSLLILNRLEQALKIPGPKTLMVIPLNKLKEQRRPILNRFRKNLQQIPFVIIVNLDPILFQQINILFNSNTHVRYIVPQISIITRRNLQKVNTSFP